MKKNKQSSEDKKNQNSQLVPGNASHLVKKGALSDRMKKQLVDATKKTKEDVIPSLTKKASELSKEVQDKSSHFIEENEVKELISSKGKEVKEKAIYFKKDLSKKSARLMEEYELKKKASNINRRAKETALIIRQEVEEKSSKVADYIEGTALQKYIDKIDDAVGFTVPRKDYEFKNEAVKASAGPIVVGLWLFFVVFIVFGLWAVFAPLESAAVASGTVVLDANKKTIQHLEGGIISEILVREGDAVKARQTLIRLDDTNARARAVIFKDQLHALKAVEARLKAERDGLDKVSFDPELLSEKNNPSVAQIIRAQAQLFDTRKKSLDGQVGVLRQRVAQFADEIKGLESQEQAARRQLELIDEEVVVVSQLVDEGKAVRPRLLALQRKVAELEGNRGEFLSLIARAGQSITEAELSVINMRNEFLSEVVAQLHETQEEIANIQERLNAAQDVLDRIEIAAPQAGIITGLKYHTIGGVIAPGAPIMDIVPQDDELIIEAQVKPQDIDVVHQGMLARVRLTAFKVRRVPTLEGNVTYVSADRFVDEVTGIPYYLARIKIDREVLESVTDDVELYPGMPADVLIVTGARTVMSYLFDPITDTFDKAFKEQ